VIGAHAREYNDLGRKDLFWRSYVNYGITESGEGVADGTDIACPIVEEGDG